MSGRMQREKDALASVAQEQVRLIEESHKKGKMPADYSLGFANAILFLDHRLNMRPGKPKFYDRTTSIGALPKPMALRHDKYKDMLGAEQMFESMRDAVILAARNLVAVPEDETRYPALDALAASLKTMDGFVDQISELEAGAKAEPAPAPIQEEEPHVDQFNGA